MQDHATYLNYHEIRRVLCSSNQHDYTSLPRKISNYTLMMLDRNWTSFFKSIKDYKKNPDKYTGKPSLPKYLDKIDGRYIAIYEKGAISKKVFKKNNKIKLSQSNIEFYTKIKDFDIIQEVRIVPQNNQYTIEVVYKKEVKELKQNNGKYCSIDLGLNNLATITFSDFSRPYIINGKPLKSINQYYNKRLAHYKSKLENVNKGKKSSKRTKRINNKRTNKVNDYLHKSSRYIVNQLVSKKVNTLIIGNNKQWKQDINIGKMNNQNFVQIPHSRFISMLAYKCELEGINVVITEESYTSKCSFLDGEAITKHEQYKGKRIKRGLFKSSDGTLINADVNGSYNIMRKAIPNALADGIEGLIKTKGFDNTVNPLIIKL